MCRDIQRKKFSVQHLPTSGRYLIGHTAMELTWLPDTPQARSRRRAPRACPACQRRKVRHNLSEGSGRDENSS